MKTSISSLYHLIQYLLGSKRVSKYEFVPTTWIEKSDWLTIKGGLDILIYSAGQGLMILPV